MRSSSGSTGPLADSGAHAAPTAHGGTATHDRARTGAAPGREAPEVATSRGAEGCGCGWFESSRSLREGVEVREHEVLDPIVNELPLAWWIEWAGLHADAHRQ